MKEKIKSIFVKSVQAVLACAALCVLTMAAAYVLGIAARILWVAFLKGFNLL